MRPTRVMGLAGLSIAMLGASAQAEVASEITFGAHSDYVFRGVNIGEDMFDFSLDFSGSGDCGFDWAAGFWLASFSPNADFGDPDYEDELNIYAGISKEFNNIALELGVIKYIFLDDGDSSNMEVYLSASTTVNVIDLAATLYWNADATSGGSTTVGDLYYEFAASYGFEVADMALEIGAAIAFFDSNFAGGESGLANYSAYLAATKQISEDISITPYVQAVWNDEDWSDLDADGSGDDVLVGGIRTTFTF